MSNRHLPAGQALDGAGGAGVGMSPSHGGPGPSPGPRRGGRPPSYHQSHSHYNGSHHPQQPHMQHPPVYANYMVHQYPAAYGYPHAAPIPPPYQNGAAQYYQPNMPSQSYMPYAPQQYARSPPNMPQYLHSMGMANMPPQPVPQQQQQQQPAYPRNQQSPIVVSSPYPTPPVARSVSHNHAMVPPPQTAHHAAHHQPPPHAPAQYAPPPVAQAPRPEASPARPAAAEPEAPPTPSTTSSARAPAGTAPVTPPTPQTAETSAELPASPKTRPQVNISAVTPSFRPPLPWFTHPDQAWPRRTSKIKRSHKALEDQTQPLALPPKDDQTILDSVDSDACHRASDSSAHRSSPDAGATASADPTSSASASSQDQPSGISTSPTTPTSAQATPSSTSAPMIPGKATKTVRAAVPAVPLIPALPKVSPKAGKQSAPEEVVAEHKAVDGGSSDADLTASTATLAADGTTETAATTPAPAAPKSWANLFSKTAAAATTVASPVAGPAAQAGVNGSSDHNAGVTDRPAGVTGFAQANNNSLAEALRAYRVGNSEKLSFIEPRGLINTGNMCYMNSVLQVLLFCTPFYDFLEQAGKNVAHSFNSETPLIDAMIEFMRDFKIIDSAVSVDQLRRRLKSEELEQYGEPFTPEFIYEAIKKLPRFSSMRRGHQQDAEEFLGFFLESLHDECAHVMRAAPPATTSATPSSAPTPAASVTSAGPGDNDWLEVGPRQRAAITRSSGHSDTSSPVTKIFGGQLRSELRVPGLKDSVTLEPYQPLQLDIGAPQVRNIVDALRHLTNPESLRGDFNSPRGKDVSATKQVFIESLPPVLILHLKRFQFDAEGNGTIKIWKKIGYPLELEIPREILSRSKRTASSLPKYRLIAAVYHHGKNASGGHYTADVRRQDGNEWIRLDDTVIRRVRSEEVAEGGAEEEPSRTESTGRKEAAGGYSTAAGNRFAGMGDEEAADEDGWKQVSTPASGGKKWSSVVNNATTAANKTKMVKDNIKDNKVAYLLFYQRI